MKKGLDINIRGITNSIHFDIINGQVKEGGSLDWDALGKGFCQISRWEFLGKVYEIRFYLGSEDKMLYAEVLQ